MESSLALIKAIRELFLSLSFVLSFLSQFISFGFCSTHVCTMHNLQCWWWIMFYSEFHTVIIMHHRLYNMNIQSMRLGSTYVNLMVYLMQRKGKKKKVLFFFYCFSADFSMKFFFSCHHFIHSRIPFVSEFGFLFLLLLLLLRFVLLVLLPVVCCVWCSFI